MTAKEKLDDLLNPFADRIKWEEEIIYEIEIEGACNTSDAQGIMNAQPFIVEDCWKRNIGANKTAKRILNA
jgi:hypothetical protein